MKYCKIFLVTFSLLSISCKPSTADWQHLDLEKDDLFGISTEKAYEELLESKEPLPVIVAVLDGGIEVEHEDLQAVMWVNDKEIPNNGLDDDQNGYIDDVHGWNFVTSPTNTYQYDNMELTRLVRRDDTRFSGITASSVAATDREDFENYQKNVRTLEKKILEAEERLESLQKVKVSLDQVVKQLGKENPTLQDFRSFMPKNDAENRARSWVNVKMKRKTFAEFYQEDVIEMLERFREHLDYHYNINFNPRDNDAISIHKGHTLYGNNDVAGPDAQHGSHVAGIIAAVRNNDIGIQGIADHVQIMAVRNTPKGDERDQDVANAIRYAVDNGAKIINMSFGKRYTENKALVDSAVKYAASEDVLLIHAAGNDNLDLEENPHYPNPFYLDGGQAETWITVGASDQANDETLKASFSNFGKTQVDVFAPGVRINSTVPGSQYKRMDGTSMAAPVVAGLAALIRSYYPELTAVQVRDIILESVIQVDQLTDRCVTGGVVNAYQALQLAAQYNH